MAVVDDDGPPPAELRLYWQCQRYSALPDPGGVLDQDSALLFRMAVCDNIHNAVQRWRTLVGAKVHQLTDNERAILRWLIDLKVLNG